MARKGLTCTLLSAALLFAACGGDDSTASSDDTKPTTDTTTAAVDTDAVFKWGHSGTTLTMDPVAAASGTVIVYFTPVFDSLTVLNAEGQLEPGIATDWETSDDGLTLTLTLAEGRTFQDGTPLDADAVVANLERARAEGATTARFLAPVDAISAPDATTVVIHTLTPAADLPAVLADYAGMMVSPASFDSPDITTKPIGSGPFKIVDNTEAGVTYERWDGYHDAENIKLAGMEILGIADDAARLNALRSGQIDATFIRSNAVGEATSAGLLLDQVDRVQIYGLQLNTGRSELGRPEVRQAIMHAFDRAAINKGIYDDGCTPAVQYFPESFQAYDPSLVDAPFGTFDVDESTTTVTHHVQASLVPSWVGTDLRRTYRFEGNRLHLTAVTSSVVELTWEREAD